MKHWRNVIWNVGALFVAVGVDTTLLARGAEARGGALWRRKKNCPVRPASIKPGPVSAALPGNRSTLQNSHQRKKK